MLYIEGSTWNTCSDNDGSHAIEICGKRIVIVPCQLNSSHTVSTSTSIWDCSVILSKMLEHQKIDFTGKKFIEVGAGRGLASMAAKMMKADVVSTDIAPALPALMETVKLNGFGWGSNEITVAPLDWTESTNALFELNFDFILAADVVWVTELISLN